MAIAPQSRTECPEDEVGYYDITPSLGYTGFAILLVIAIYFSAQSCGTRLADLSLMAVLP